MFRSSTPETDIVLFEMIDQQSDADGRAYIAALDALAERSEPAILIFRVAGFINQDHEIRKQAAAWFKRNRDRLDVFAKGLIRVDEGHHHGDDDHDHEDAHEDAEDSNFARMLPFAVKRTDNLDHAFDLARNWAAVSKD
ncbi:hypothetical protein [Thalassospira sp.]|uniref:hypothetical protein n=1 Tax=Thalassospira sp. TaxID=1912094 RepID=UPI000C46A022|nr:hypothetical protein [Thalassospira sp.]MBC08284.1 hypothetical protein [Thalassospira sp.]|tara:strand:- start:9880 stop:10296 length:417 start_codon:yes stop_codon:yes gene_type:complete